MEAFLYFENLAFTTADEPACLTPTAIGFVGAKITLIINRAVVLSGLILAPLVVQTACLIIHLSVHTAESCISGTIIAIHLS